jgi:hypothetical protein
MRQQPIEQMKFRRSTIRRVEDWRGARMGPSPAPASSNGARSGDAGTLCFNRAGLIIGRQPSERLNAALCVACHGVRSQLVPIAPVGLCSMPVV